jgi:L-fuculose-phosphate aldolase
VSKGFMTPDMMVTTDLAGNQLTGERRPSSELLMHLAVYEHRPEITAVVHAHPPTATGFAVAGIPLVRAVLAEVVATLGSIPLAGYGTPSTPELPDAVRKYIKAHDGMLLANHGALTIGTDVFNAYYKMVTVEHFAKISLVARQLGREHMFSREEVEKLQSLRGRYGVTAAAPICLYDEEPATSEGEADCQEVEAPEGPPGAQLVSSRRVGASDASEDDEIRLTYRELTALIEDAVRNLK